MKYYLALPFIARVSDMCEVIAMLLPLEIIKGYDVFFRQL